MCREGGCGSCVVVLQNKDPVTQKKIFLAVNSVRKYQKIRFCNGVLSVLGTYIVV